MTLAGVRRFSRPILIVREMFIWETGKGAYEIILAPYPGSSFWRAGETGEVFARRELRAIGVPGEVVWVLDCGGNHFAGVVVSFWYVEVGGDGWLVTPDI